MEEKKGFWGLVEVMGHQRIAGYIHEEILGGAAFIRVDVPAVEYAAGKKLEAWSRLLGAASIYAITPTTEEIARGLAKQMQKQPISVYDLPQEIRDRLESRPAIGHAPSNQRPYSDAELGLDADDDESCEDDFEEDPMDDGFDQLAENSDPSSPEA